MKDCLVIIDVQKGFLNDENKCIIDKLENLINGTEFNYVVATKYVNTKDSPHYTLMGWDGMMDKESQELDPLVEDVADRVFEKSTNSCFTEEFKKFLADEGIEKLYFVGLDTDCCVMKSAFDAFDMKLSFKVLTSYCASSGGEDLHNAACKLMLRNLGSDCIE